MRITKIEDYIEKIQEKFPGFSRWEIEKILGHGMRSYYLYNWTGGDVILYGKQYVLYAGKLFADSLLFNKYSQLKYSVKFRVKYKRKRVQFSGKYYFGMTEDQFQVYKSKYMTRSKRRRKVIIDRMVAYKIKEECFVNTTYKHFFEFDYPIDVGFSFYKTDFLSRSIKYIAKRNNNKEIEPIT